MADITLEQAILEQLRKLNADQQNRVLEFARNLSQPRGEPGKLFLERIRDIHIDPADLEIMRQVAEEDCEQIDLDEWNKPIFST